MSDMPCPPPTNGKGAAAILAVGIGAAVLGVFTLSGDAIPAAARLFNVWNPTGPLSGVTGLAIVIWLLAWWLLARLWGGRNVSLKRVNWATGLMVILGLLLTFPPVMDFLQGK